MKTSVMKKISTSLLASLLIIGGCTTPQTSSEKEEKVTLHDSNVRAPVPLKARLSTQPPMQYSETTATTGYARSRDILPLPPHSPYQRESYNSLGESGFITTVNDPLSTFSIDVDTASYSNIRRFIQNGQLPPVGAIRIEEMVNYFPYTNPRPQSEPFLISTEIGPCPWQDENRLVRISLQARELDKSQLPPSNLVFLIDVSGSMNHANKLPLLKKSLLMLLDTLSVKDRISIVVYAGSDRVVLKPTPGNKKEAIRKAIHNLSSGGSTHASSGIHTAYDLALQSFMPGGNNRIILASDGDFNVGTTSRGELERLITVKKESGVYLTVLGFGMDNFHDDTMEILADKGNGNYAYIDSLLEAKKVLVKERASTLFALANDVKLQVEFNPAMVGGYRLIGYENRVLADEDFNNDKKDAGEIGLGHTVTALYEVIPKGSKTIPTVDPLKYQKTSDRGSDEILTVKLRYKPLQNEQSRLLTQSLHDNENVLGQMSNDFRFAAAVAGYGLLLQHSEYVGKLAYPDLINLAKSSRGQDDEGYRAEFIRLVKMSEILTR